MRSYLFVLIVFLVSGPVVAQFSDSTNYYLKYSSTGIINKTNEQNSYVLNNSVRLNFYKKNFSINTTNGWIYGKQQHRLANNDFISTIDFDLFKTDRHIYYWGLVNFEKSFSLKIDNRIQAGLGLGYYLIDRESLVIQVSDGILYERSELTAPENLETYYETARNSLRVKFRYVFKDHLSLENINFLQHSLEDKKDYIIRSTTHLSVKLYKWFSISANITYNKLNITSRENLLVNYGLTFERYF
jgi:hypothetical protein